METAGWQKSILQLRCCSMRSSGLCKAKQVCNRAHISIRLHATIHLSAAQTARTAVACRSETDAIHKHKGVTEPTSTSGSIPPLHLSAEHTTAEGNLARWLRIMVDTLELPIVKCFAYFWVECCTAAASINTRLQTILATVVAAIPQYSTRRHQH